jgi:predicted transcriptional regulator
MQDRDERIVEDIKDELALLRRDLIDRLRRIEDYIQFVESDVGRLKRDLERIDEKLREKTVERSAGMITRLQPTSELKAEPIPVKKEIETVQPLIQQNPTPIVTQSSITPSVVKPIDKKEGLNQTEVAIIRFLIDNPGTKSATPIAQSLGKAREHIARTLKKLADEKKIIRDETTWPYTYVVPDEVKQIVVAQPIISQSPTPG